MHLPSEPVLRIPSGPALRVPSEMQVRVEHTGNGTDFEVHGVEVGTSLAISVPASFSVVACREGRTANLRMDGWIEGGVRLTTEQGDVGVQTVRGMLTTLATGAGNIAAEMIDGDAALSTGQGDITIGKLQGKVLNAASGGGNVSAKALYCEDAHIATRNGRVQLNFLHTLRASVAVSNGEVNIDALDGSVSVRAAETWRFSSPTISASRPARAPRTCAGTRRCSRSSRRT
ncbi:hypothetical protein T492DRAFT_155331 [Pavlovales sp. CCMP2436]|nr:hypothetical protein T492DRAFT_155331 [Pavlovales sp. CCMP2436]